MGSEVKAIQIEWRDGRPFPVEKQLVTKDDIRTLRFAAQTLPYKGKRDDEGYYLDDFEREMDGKPSAEVIAARVVQKAAQGDNDMIKYNEDRILGKPTQIQESLNIQGTWADLASAFRKREEDEPLGDPDLQEYTDVELTDDYRLIEEVKAEKGETIEVPEPELNYLEEFF